MSHSSGLITDRAYMPCSILRSRLLSRKLDRVVCATMGKKSFDDGPALTIQEAVRMSCPWSGMDMVKDKLAKGQRLLEGTQKSPSGDVHASLQNIEKNAGILRPLVEQMKQMKRMSAWPIEVYGVLCVAFYEGHKECYMGRPGNESFNPEPWGFRQAWSMHKMISALRTKAQRDEMPRELSLGFANILFCLGILRNSI